MDNIMNSIVCIPLVSRSRNGYIHTTRILFTCETTSQYAYHQRNTLEVR